MSGVANKTPTGFIIFGRFRFRSDSAIFQINRLRLILTIIFYLTTLSVVYYYTFIVLNGSIPI